MKRASEFQLLFADGRVESVENRDVEGGYAAPPDVAMLDEGVLRPFTKTRHVGDVATYEELPW